ncbi:EAL domain-containing protein [Aromatoleum sp.]|uniref:EAL domain-containing protein n=1 Tax=Aromatoleum sp. TaxID=2307007 RepID=UPI002FC78394
MPKRPSSPFARRPADPCPAAVSTRSRPACLGVVAIGASAGGLAALFELFGRLPANLGFAYVVAQHVAADHDTALPQLIGERTSIAVRTLADGDAPQPNVAYVVPPSMNAVFRDRALRLVAIAPHMRPSPSVNELLCSLAEEAREMLVVGVILSGTGSDGAAGVRAIKAEGGFSFAQDPASAEYDGMPRAAIDTGCVDWVLDPARIADELVRLAGLHDAVPPAGDQAALKRLLGRLRQQGNVDFSRYKEAMLWRRIHRRIAATHTRALEEYVELACGDAGELERLQREFLISVTGFFRDPAAFAALAQVAAELVDGKHLDDPIRVWVPACATGEEVYSIAIVLDEALHAAGVHAAVQIFASDIDTAALAVGRAGRYPAGALVDVDPARVERYFVPADGGFEVVKRLRDMVVFARHDVLVDPPFTRLDLLSCRNLLIYLLPACQDRVLGTFGYALRPGGHLLLGKSEAVAQTEELFAPVDVGVQLYRRTSASARVAPPRSYASRTAVEPGRRGAEPGAGRDDRLLSALASLYARAAIVVDRRLEIRHIHGDASPFLTMPAGAANLSLPLYIREDYRTELQTLVFRVNHDRTPAAGSIRPLPGAPGRGIRLAVYPFGSDERDHEYLCVFEYAPLAVPAAAGNAADGDGEGSALRAARDELVSAREYVQTLLDELAASHEQLQPLNEELQSTVEELKASNEELQSMNEELATSNAELQQKTGELGRANRDLETILSNQRFPVVVVDAALHLRRYNEAAAETFDIGRRAVGRDLRDCESSNDLSEVAEMLADAIRSGVRGERLLSVRQRHYLAHSAVYRNDRHEIAGAIAVLADTTTLVDTERRLRDTQEQLLAIMNNSSALIMIKRVSGEYEFVNAGFAQLFGMAPAAVAGKTDIEVLPRQIVEVLHDREIEVLRRRGPVQSEDALPLPDGERHLLALRFPLFGDNGSVHSICTLATDVTELRRSERQTLLYGRAFESVGEGVVITDVTHRIISVNPTFMHLTGHALEDVGGHDAAVCALDPAHECMAPAIWDAVSRDGRWQGEIALQRKDGSTIPAWLAVSSVADAGGVVTNYVAVFTDLTQVKETRRLEYLATHDELTGLANRNLFFDRLGHAVARCERQHSRLSLQFIDLDNFKTINDTLGHDAGDHLLEEIGRRISQCVRAQDTVARMGGDEFSVLIEDAQPGEVRVMAQRIVDSFAAPVRLGEREVHTTASVGISNYPEDGRDIQTLLKNADTAMYEAKETGKNALQFFSSALDARAQQRRVMELDLRRAIDQQEFFLVYQPQVEFAAKGIASVEALLRWRHPTRGLVPPLQFIPVAEDCGLIIPIGEWVLRAACAQIHAWQAVIPEPPRVAINVSPRQFRRPGMVQSIRQALEDSGVEAKFLEVEVTERALTGDLERLLGPLTELRELGVHVTIDDFGTGYSSLSCLKRLPIDHVKIDKSFIDAIEHDADDNAITRAIIGMSHTLGMQVVAEGIEHAGQYDILRATGCDLGQGYFFSEPLLPADVIALLHRQGWNAT